MKNLQKVATTLSPISLTKLSKKKMMHIETEPNRRMDAETDTKAGRERARDNIQKKEQERECIFTSILRADRRFCGWSPTDNPFLIAFVSWLYSNCFHICEVCVRLFHAYVLGIVDPRCCVLVNVPLLSCSCL